MLNLQKWHTVLFNSKLLSFGFIFWDSFIVDLDHTFKSAYYLIVLIHHNLIIFLLISIYILFCLLLYCKPVCNEPLWHVSFDVQEHLENIYLLVELKRPKECASSLLQTLSNGCLRQLYQFSLSLVESARLHPY